jgi:protein-tyrosine phosphatase
MPYRILTVCTGNICRSPSAAVVLLHHLKAAGLGELVEVDSAGIEDFHSGEPPSSPAIRAATARGYDLSRQRARQVMPRDFEAFDLILAMDSGHLKRLAALQPKTSSCRVSLFLEVLPEAGPDLADPYYGTDADYETMMDLIEAAVPAWVASLQKDQLTPA